MAHAMPPALSVAVRSIADGPLYQRAATLTVPTAARRCLDLSAAIGAWLGDIGAGDGVVTLQIRHTSASLTIQENADPEVQDDLLMALDRLAPENAGYTHSYEGPDDMPGHIKTALTDTTLAVPVFSGRMDLGRWQAVYLIEHRAQANERSVTLVYQGTIDAGSA